MFKFRLRTCWWVTQQSLSICDSYDYWISFLHFLDSHQETSPDMSHSLPLLLSTRHMLGTVVGAIAEKLENPNLFLNFICLPRQGPLMFLSLASTSSLTSSPCLSLLRTRTTNTCLAKPKSGPFGCEPSLWAISPSQNPNFSEAAGKSVLSLPWRRPYLVSPYWEAHRFSHADGNTNIFSFQGYLLYKYT